jgi:hypothetical protein
MCTVLSSGDARRNKACINLCHYEAYTLLGQTENKPEMRMLTQIPMCIFSPLLLSFTILGTRSWGCGVVWFTLSLCIAIKRQQYLPFPQGNVEVIIWFEFSRMGWKHLTSLCHFLFHIHNRMYTQTHTQACKYVRRHICVVSMHLCINSSKLTFFILVDTCLSPVMRRICDIIKYYSVVWMKKTV